ncbi:hypothetical protein LF916_01265 [Bifidobacterium pseudolongum]|uniref:hypothetical protein n=1 Tax=Bifidobacterium pseudolongum TaxID=1694 RepID=UPI001F0F179F|nr:hypothetical protein [Bifidobacterium pseudolongum]MCH4859528.1 hypothetical protein [Bifidobacterium pseudolongum]MCH4861299.1 hypothetical protein [Bifidobacterium pseudolongum]
MEQNVYRLPLLSHATALSTLPGQPVDASYSLVKDLDQPKGGLGYVAQVVGRRKVRVLAWISEDMKVFPTAQTLASEPDGRGELHFDPWTDTPNSGAVRVQSSDGFDRTITIGEYAVDGGTAWLTACTEDLGAYREGKHPLAVLIAACWIGACLVPRLAGKTVGAGAGRISELFRDMMDKPLPDGLDEIIWRGTTNNAGQSSVFERFAARQLVEAGAGQIRQIEGEHPLSVIRLDSTDLFWMRFDDDEIEGLQRDLVLGVEAALNRLSFVDLDARGHDNGMGLVSTLTEEECFRAATRSMHMWATHAKFVQQEATVENPEQTVRGTKAARGGAWDVMTRFIAICERLKLPFRLEYLCDVDPKSGQMAVTFSVPTASMMPGSDFVGGQWVDMRAQRAGRAASYALRLAGLLAQAAFTTGARVTSVDVTGRLGSLSGQPVLSLGFDRSPFQMGVQPAYVSGRFDDAAQDNDPAAIVQMLQPARHALRFGADRGLMPVEPLPLPKALVRQHVPLWKDKRELPDDIKTLVRADYAYELDVMHDDCVVKGPEIWDIVNQNEDSPVTAMFEVESALMQIESTEKDHGDRKPLYCEHPLMRLLMVNVEGKATDRYWKLPDAVYNAHGALSRLNRELGERDKAVAQSEEMMRLAPTTARGAIELSLDYTDVGEDYAGSADALIRGLKTALMPIDVGFMYYRLGYALWKTNSHKAGLACYAMVLSMPEGPFHDRSRDEANQLLAEMGEEELPDRDRAEQTLRAAGIPVAPPLALLEQLAKVAIMLVDAGFPLAADEAVWLLGIMQPADVLPALRRSLRWGAAGITPDSDE